MKTLLSKLILDFGKYPNQKTHERESAGYLVQALPMVHNQFSHKVIYNYNSFFKEMGALQSVFKKVKKMILHCIFKM